jgi:diguanylate cyclase (GGDEF)-like protein
MIGEPTVSRARPLVLVADDDETMRLLIRASLEKAGFEVEEAKRGMEALAVFDRTHPDVVLLDVVMPEMDGFATCRRLRQLPDGEHVPVLMVTALDDAESIDRAYDVGATDFISKPIKWATLGYHVRYMLRAARAMVDLSKSLEVIQHNANFDRLTDLPNRNLLYDRLQQAILAAQRENQSVALLTMDLDRFKEINNTLGHQSGDLLLQQIGPRLRGILRQSDTVARLGGDEFAVLLPSGTCAEHATEVARKIMKAMEHPFTIGDLQLDVEASIGIAVFPDHGTDVDTLIKRADAVMYVAKEGRSGYNLYSPEQDKSSTARLMLMGELRRAIAEDQLFLLYQPKIDLRSGRIAGVEALVRWQHPERGVIPPDQFIPLAEQTGLIAPLTECVLQKALHQCRAWRGAGIETSVAVNLSRRNLQSPELPGQISRMLKTCEVSSDALQLEITESTIMANPERAMGVLGDLKRMGLRLSLDDFGTGYSSLAYLKKLPVDEIKIDKSFVMNMHSKTDDVAIVHMIIELSHILGLKVVAEGLENQESMDRLIALGCDMAQGYYISRPVPVEEISRRFSEVAKTQVFGVSSGLNKHGKPVIDSNPSFDPTLER